jgi:hypothetical protein
MQQTNVWREWSILEVQTGLRQGTFKERDRLEDIGLLGWVILKEILEKKFAWIANYY